MDQIWANEGGIMVRFERGSEHRRGRRRYQHHRAVHGQSVGASNADRLAMGALPQHYAAAMAPRPEAPRATDQEEGR